jgi:hypothetical protein
MDNLTINKQKTTNKREIIEKLLSEYVEYLKGSNLSAQAETESTNYELILDREKDRYLLIETGWLSGQRIYDVLIHIDIIARKLWIQKDGTEEGIADELVTMGIRTEQIVLAYKSLARRQITEFAVS